MKPALLVCLASLPFLVTPARAEKTDFQALKGSLSESTRLLKESLEVPAARQIANDLQRHIDNIHLDLNERLPGGYGKPTPQSAGFLKELGGTLEPYEADMVTIAFETRSGKGGAAAVGIELFSLLDFATADSSLDHELRDALEEYPAQKWEIYRKLFEHRLMTQADIDQLAALGPGITDPKEKIKWAEQMAFYGSDAGLDVFEELLTKPFDPSGLTGSTGIQGTNESMAAYGPALKAISYLGPKASRLSPLVNEREAEMTKAIEPLVGKDRAEPFLIGWKATRMYLTGKMKTVETYAKNGTGLLRVNHGTDGGPDAVTDSERDGARTGRRHPGAESEETADTQPFRRSKTRGWILGGCLVVLLILRQILVAKKKRLES